MTHPRQLLSPEERALAAQLPRLHGRGEPDPTLDARILAAARAAMAPRPAARPRLRWIAPMAVAASLSLAVGLAWRLRPPPAPHAGAPLLAETAVTEIPEARLPMASPSPGNGPGAQSQQSPAFRSAPGRQQPVVDASAQEPMQPVTAPLPPPAPPAPPAPAPPPAAERAAATTDMAAAPITPASSPAMAKAARATEGLRERQPTATGATLPQAQSNEAAQAADSGVQDPQPFLADDPGEDVPPATVDSPEVRSAWLRRIGELLQEGRNEEARASLAEFRRRYPDAPLPPELRALEP